jgi:hypothetical protein
MSPGDRRPRLLAIALWAAASPACFTPTAVVSPRPDAGGRDAAFADSGALPSIPDAGGRDAASGRDASAGDPDAAGESWRHASSEDAAFQPDASQVCFREESGPCLERVCDSDGWCWEHPLPMALRLNSIHGSDDSNVWAVGRAGLAVEYDGQDFILHHAPTGEAVGVWAGGRRDVWVIAADQALHWDGDGWATHRPAPGVSLTAIWGAGPEDVWAAGRGRAFQWDGTTWTERPLPGIGLVSAVEGTGADDVWLVGGGSDYHNGPGQVLHWDGATWSQVYEQPGSSWGFRDVMAVSAHEVWAVAYDCLAHWDGTTWTSVAAPESPP